MSSNTVAPHQTIGHQLGREAVVNLTYGTDSDDVGCGYARLLMRGSEGARWVRSDSHRWRIKVSTDTPIRRGAAVTQLASGAETV
jgi:hypothetical protein